jgi:hypothetical protein
MRNMGRSPMMMMSPKRRHMRMLSIATIRWLWKIAPPHGKVTIVLPQDHFTRLMIMPQVMQLLILLQAHLMVIMMDHAPAMRVMCLQAHPLHLIATCHKVTPRYLMQMWWILIHMRSF